MARTDNFDWLAPSMYAHEQRACFDGGLEVVMNRLIIKHVAFVALLCGCGPSSAMLATADPALGEPVLSAPSIAVVELVDHTPANSDGEPRYTLAFKNADGTQVLIEDQAFAYAPFRDGVALIDLKHQLVLISRDGTRRVLASRAATAPVQGSRGELYYAALYENGADVHVLERDGRDRTVASGLGNAGPLSPQADGRLVFVGVSKGGVAGLWLGAHEGRTPRCLTNCGLVTGTPWGDRFVPPPEDGTSIKVQGDMVQWRTAEGTRHTISLVPHPTIPTPGDQGKTEGGEVVP